MSVIFGKFGTRNWSVNRRIKQGIIAAYLAVTRKIFPAMLEKNQDFSWLGSVSKSSQKVELYGPVFNLTTPVIYR